MLGSLFFTSMTQQETNWHLRVAKQQALNANEMPLEVVDIGSLLK
jgi:hypothetical protein